MGNAVSALRKNVVPEKLAEITLEQTYAKIKLGTKVRTTFVIESR